MAVSRAIRRLLRVLEIEEEQCQLALESALGESRRLEQLLKFALVRERDGRRLIMRSAHTGELPDRLAGIEESRSAKCYAAGLKSKIPQAESLVSELRRSYLAKRVERRQAEMLIKETEAREAIVSARHGQQSLDDWYLNRLRASESNAPNKDDACHKEASNLTGTT